MYLSGGLTLMLLITAVSIVFTSGALQEKVHYQYGADEQFVMSEDQNFVILLLDTVDSRTITELLDEHPEYSEVFRDFTYFENTTLRLKKKRNLTLQTKSCTAAHGVLNSSPG